ncbi:RNA polymerase sigma (SigY) subunit [Tumebacillus sp. BK434]|uniref:RNA polymerase sigma factor SigY n=1 Tax=Tumebacillus sp. BK434 TaxID=2512169 RepID=UPI00104E13B6|nr:RNA polymerase sigma factor SigY [Tumebacillus sp. BK434]TCP52342.1 RNA polymerase sigma (SigY) subunit [Tumebacillus sp. BK434]
MEEREEQELIRLAVRGDAVALSLLMQQHYSFLMKYLIKVTLNPTLAEDVTQETMIKCIEKIHLYNGKAKFSSWLITIATNLYIDDLRKKKREQNWQEQEQSLRKMRWQATQHQEDWPLVLDALGGLSEDVRLPIILKHYYGYSYDEIAEIMQLAAGTVKSRIHNGLKSLRKELSPDDRS